jgi:predicted Ser/Thr protein kinase
MSRPRSIGDLLFGRVCVVNGRLKRDELRALEAERSGSAAALSVGQLLIRRRLLNADEFLEIGRWLEEPLMACPSCEGPLVPRSLSEARDDSARGELRCPACESLLDPEALVEAVPEGALLLSEPLPSSLRSLLSARESQVMGRTLGGHEILSVLGMGAMGVVYRARQLELDRPVALKVLRAGEDATTQQVERFLAEARAVAKLKHPGIVSIHEVGEERGVHFFSMDLVEGVTLQEVFSRGERVPLRRAAELVEKVSRAVHYAHERGIIHRDLKPGNIILGPGGEPHITDFGLARDVGRDVSLTRSGVAIGTPLYMSPEQVRGEVQSMDARGDVFSLGTILYHLLTGQLPFTGRSHVEIYNGILYEDPQSPRRIQRKVPRDLETICLKALEKRPRDRYRSAGAMADDLARWLRSEPIEARPLPWYERAARSARRHRAALVATVAVLLVLGAAWVVAEQVIARREREARRQASARVEADRRGLLRAARGALAAGDAAGALEQAEALALQAPEAPEAEAALLLAADATLALDRIPAARRAYARAYGAARSGAVQAGSLLGLAEALERDLEPHRARRVLESLLGRWGDAADLAREARLRLGRVRLAAGDALAARALVAAVVDDAEASAALRREARRLARWVDVLDEPTRLAGADAGACGDLDADGRPELVLLRGGEVSVYRAERGRLVPAGGDRIGGLMGRAEACAVADLLGDGGAELVVTGGDLHLGRAVGVYAASWGERSLRLTPVAKARVAGGTTPARMAVVSGAGGPEVVLARAGGARGAEPRRVRVTAAGEVLSVPLLDGLARSAHAECVAAADLDGDGRDEVLLGTAGPAGDDLRLVADPPGRVPPPARWRRRLGPVQAVAAADVDRDGRTELVVAVGAPADASGGGGAVDPGVHVLAGEAMGGQAPELLAGWDIPFAPGRGGWRVRVRALVCGDVSATGAPTICALADLERVGEPGGEDIPRALTVLLFAHAGAGSAEPHALRRVWTTGRPRWITLGDLDADGDADLVVGGPSGVWVFGVREAAR